MKRPSFQFYPGDWLNDAALRMCSVGARGLWIEMICLMHQGSTYGYLKVNGKVILPVNLARMVGATFAEVDGWLDELHGAGVFSIGDDGAIFSRRMIRDEEIRQARAAGGVKGGNPALIVKDKGLDKVDQKVNLPANLPPTPSSSSSSSSSKDQKTLSSGDDSDESESQKTGKPKADRIPYDQIFDMYEQHCCAYPYNRPRVLIRDDKRKALIKKVWGLSERTKTLEFWGEYFELATQNAHWMYGDKSKGGTWPGANFDFLLKADRVKAIVEGNV